MKSLPVRRGITEIEHLFDIVDCNKSFICGGYARYCASPNKKPVPAGDVDIYCRDEEEFKRVFDELINKEKLTTKYITEVAISFNGKRHGKFSYHPPIQLIRPIKEGAIVANGSPEDIIQNFDFTIVRCFLKSKTEIIADDDFEEDERSMKLRIKNIHCPVSSTMRFCKYSSKGYRTKLVELIKLFVDWSNRTPEYRDSIISIIDGYEKFTFDEWKKLYKLMNID